MIQILHVKYSFYFWAGEVNHDGEKILICKGGRGGGPDNGYIGEKGQQLPMILDLKLIADVGFIGWFF